MKRMVMRSTRKTSWWLLLLLGLAVTRTAAAGPGSCVGRCGESFARGQPCTCDSSCLRHDECCQDFQAVCTSDESCRGRCGETFRRGRRCECDPQCVLYRTCCHDYQLHCGGSDPPVGLLPLSAPGSSPPRPVGGKVNVHLVLSPWRPAPYRPSQGPLNGGLSGPAGSRPRPSTLKDIAQALGLSLVEEGAEEPGTGLFADVDLCSDSPIDGLTALSNGTVLIFKGELFWSVDPASRSVSHPRRIADALGVSAPIDTVFTRCNCHGNTYIIQGDQYWRLDGNMVMEPGYPKPLASEFPGLTGGISAALAVPAAGSRPETVYFFKKGDIMQRFTFPPDNTPPCSKKPGRLVRQPDVLLSAEIDLKVSLQGFPTPVTSALSVPRPQQSDRYEHYVFSGPLFFSVQILGDVPALAKPDPSNTFAPLLPLLGPAAAAAATQSTDPPPAANSIKVWLRCPRAPPGTMRPCSGTFCGPAQ